MLGRPLAAERVFPSVHRGTSPRVRARSGGSDSLAGMAQGTMMDVPLTIDHVVDRAERLMARGEIISRRPDKSVTRTTYGDVVARARRLARALVGAGIRKGDRVATLMWNHAEHLEAYFGIPLAGAAVHTLNLRLHPAEIAFIANDARDRMLIVDDVLLP